VQKYASYLIFSSSKMRQRQEAVKLFIAAMHDNTIRDRWVVDEEWVRHTSTDLFLALALAMAFFSPCSAILTQSYGKSIRQFWLIFA
jgi:hypothetical protein